MFDEFKLHSKIGFFETRKEMVIFMLNVILNIQKYVLDFCKYDEETICLPCEIAGIFDEKVTYEIYKNCLNIDMLLKIKENLNVQLDKLQESHEHFLCKILNEKYKHYEQKCIFTCNPISICVRKAYLEWEKMRIDKIVNRKTTVFVKDYFKDQFLSFYEKNSLS